MFEIRKKRVKPPRYKVAKVPVRQLLPGQVDAMWALYQAYYENADRTVFDRDLAAKDFVFLGTDQDSGRIVGFCAALFFKIFHKGVEVGFYYTGDTVFHPDYWGQKALHWATLSEWIKWRVSNPGVPLYWYLICSGHRTYLSLVRNFPTHWPHHRRPTPRFERSLLDRLGRDRFAEAWHPELGVISVPGPQVVFKQEADPLTPRLLELPEIRFFIKANPGHLRGDELAMIALVDLDAVLWMARRWVGKTSAGLIRKLGLPFQLPQLFMTRIDSGLPSTPPAVLGGTDDAQASLGSRALPTNAIASPSPDPAHEELES